VTTSSVSSAWLQSTTLKRFYASTATVEPVAGTPPFLSSSPRDELLMFGSGVKATPNETVYVVSLSDSETPGIDFHCP
jgi:hypothetical protein